MPFSFVTWIGFLLIEPSQVYEEAIYRGLSPNYACPIEHWTRKSLSIIARKASSLSSRSDAIGPQA